MNKIIIGCDPDSDKSGWAVVKNGELITLTCLSLIEIYESLHELYLSTNHQAIELHIENVNGTRCSSFNWIRDKNKQKEKKVNAKISESVGKCKSAQSQIERIANHFGIKVVHHPVSKMWKDSKTGKAALKEVFGYEGQSNEDSRSACYFAYRALQMNK